MANRVLIICSGIGGNELEIQSPLGIPNVTVWLNYAALLAGGWRLMQLGSDGRSPILPGLPRLVPGQVLQAYYSDLQTVLTRAGYSPQSFVVDWRLRINDSAQSLANLISDFGTGNPVSIICHSRGGLILRAALALMDPLDRRDKVGRVIACGTPHRGSFAGIDFLLGRGLFVQGVAAVLQAPTVLTPLGPLFPSVNAVMCSWPSLYELLPDASNPYLNPDITTAVYLAASYRSVTPNVSQVWLDAARARWTSQPALDPQIQWLDIVGEGFATITDLGFRNGVPSVLLPVTTLQGDGAVPSGWAVQAGRPYVIVNVDHQGLMWKPASTRLILRYVDQNQPLPAPPG